MSQLGMEGASVFADLGAWNWLILAAVFFGLELFLRRVFFLWFGVAALAVGMIAFATGMPWPWQLMLFAGLSIATVVLVRRYLRWRKNEARLRSE